MMQNREAFDLNKVAEEELEVFSNGNVQTMEETIVRSKCKRGRKSSSASRPDWLPDGWEITSKVRSGGKSIGHVDKFYVELSGKGLFRSKNEVLHYLETGSRRKRKLNSEANAKSPASQKEKKSSMIHKKFNSGNMHPQSVLSSVHTDAAQEA